MNDDTKRTCGSCPFFAPPLEELARKPADYGPCVVDGELVCADSPQCSNAPARHARPISDDIGGMHEQDSDNQPAKA